MEVLHLRAIVLHFLKLWKNHILPRLPGELDIIRVRRQAKDEIYKDFGGNRRQRVEGALCWLKDNNPAYGDIVIDDSHIQNLHEDGKLPNLRTVEFSEKEDTRNANFKAVQENTHVVVSYFNLCTQCYHENLLKPVIGVSDYW